MKDVGHLVSKLCYEDNRANRVMRILQKANNAREEAVLLLSASCSQWLL